MSKGRVYTAKEYLRKSHVIDHSVNTSAATPVGTTVVLSGVKYDQEKPDISLLSSKALLKVADVMTYGKKKYSAHNWRGGIAYSRLISAAQRHLLAFQDGEDKDPESKLSHLAHASCCLMMLLEFEQTRPDLDDRYGKTKKT